MQRPIVSHRKWSNSRTPNEKYCPSHIVLKLPTDTFSSCLFIRTVIRLCFQKWCDELMFSFRTRPSLRPCCLFSFLGKQITAPLQECVLSSYTVKVFFYAESEGIDKKLIYATEKAFLNSGYVNFHLRSQAGCDNLHF